MLLTTGGGELPRPLMRRVLLALSLQEGWGNVGWASDWGANIFAPTSFLGGARDPPREHAVRTQFTAPDGSSVDKTWRVTTKWAAVHDLGALTEYAAGRLAEEEVPRSALQVLEVVLRSGVSGAQCVSWLHASVCYITQNTVLCAVRVLAACQCVLYHTEHSAVRSACPGCMPECAVSHRTQCCAQRVCIYVQPATVDRTMASTT
jgi:hypothetical protein